MQIIVNSEPNSDDANMIPKYNQQNWQIQAVYFVFAPLIL